MEAETNIVKYENTLLAYFDILAYSACIEINSFDNVQKKIRNVLIGSKITGSANIVDVSINSLIFSDSIIIVINTSRYPVFRGALEVLLGSCSSIMADSMMKGLPLRGAIGAGYFYRDGDVIISSALVDAAKYEKEQNWLGAVFTPNALKIVEECKKREKDEINATDYEYTDFKSHRFEPYVRYGNIPWKNNDKKIFKPAETFYLKPFKFAVGEWAKKYLPTYFEQSEKIKNSHVLYGMI